MGGRAKTSVIYTKKHIRSKSQLDLYLAGFISSLIPSPSLGRKPPQEGERDQEELGDRSFLPPPLAAWKERGGIPLVEREGRAQLAGYSTPDNYL